MILDVIKIKLSFRKTHVYSRHISFLWRNPIGINAPYAIVLPIEKTVHTILLK